MHNQLLLLRNVNVLYADFYIEVLKLVDKNVIHL